MISFICLMCVTSALAEAKPCADSFAKGAERRRELAEDLNLLLDLKSGRRYARQCDSGGWSYVIHFMFSFCDSWLYCRSIDN